MKKNFIYILLLVVFAIGIIGFIFIYPSMQNIGKPKKLIIGVVDFQRLVSLHPDYGKLNEIDNQIALLQREIEQNSDTALETNLTQEQYAKMQQFKNEAQTELASELRDIKSTLAEKKMQGEKDLHKEAEKIRAEMGTSKDAQSVSGPTNFAQDLYILRQRQIEAKRIEIENKLKQDIENERIKMEQEVNEEMQNTTKADQQKKLKMEFDLMSPDNQTNKEELEKEYNKIKDDEKKIKDQKQAEMNIKLEVYKRDKTDQAKKELAAYQDKLDTDLKKQLGGKNLDNKEMASLKKDYDQKRYALETRLKELSKQSEAKLQERQKELEKKLQEQAKELMSESIKQQTNTAQSEKENVKILRQQLAMLQKQRDELFAQIKNDIEKIMDKVAKNNKLDYVIGNYITNLQCQDVTDLVILELKKGVK